MPSSRGTPESGIYKHCLIQRTNRVTKRLRAYLAINLNFLTTSCIVKVVMATAFYMVMIYCPPIVLRVYKVLSSQCLCLLG